MLLFIDTIITRLFLDLESWNFVWWTLWDRPFCSASLSLLFADTFFAFNSKNLKGIESFTLLVDRSPQELILPNLYFRPGFHATPLAKGQAAQYFLAFWFLRLIFHSFKILKFIYLLSCKFLCRVSLWTTGHLKKSVPMFADKLGL